MNRKAMNPLQSGLPRFQHFISGNSTSLEPPRSNRQKNTSPPENRTYRRTKKSHFSPVINERSTNSRTKTMAAQAALSTYTSRNTSPLTTVRRKTENHHQLVITSPPSPRHHHFTPTTETPDATTENDQPKPDKIVQS